MSYSHAEANLLTVQLLERENQRLLGDLRESDPGLARQLVEEFGADALRPEPQRL